MLEKLILDGKFCIPATYFTFSDTAGDYKPRDERGKKFLNINPLYCRYGFFISSEDYKKFQSDFHDLKAEKGLRFDSEIELYIFIFLLSESITKQSFQDLKLFK